MPRHGWLGVVIIAGVQAPLVVGSPVAGEWFRPVVWTGYVGQSTGWWPA